MAAVAATAPIPATQRCVLLTAYGSYTTALHYTTTYPTPPYPPLPTHIHVHVHCAAINPIDWKQASGHLRLVLRPRLPIVAGRDVAGVVVAVGSDVDRFGVGDEVMCVGECGAFGEYVSVDAGYVALKPVNLSFAEAAALPLAAQTALTGFERGGLKAGDRVVVTGASGGCGLFAVQMAKRVFGASEVVGVASGRNEELVRSAGADKFVDYTKQRLSEAVAGDKYDVVLDCVGGPEQYAEACAVLKPRGHFISIVGSSTGGPLTPTKLLSIVASSTWRRLTNAFNSSAPTYHSFFLKPSHRMLDQIGQWAGDGRLVVCIDRRFELSEAGAREMYEYASQGRTRGKVVMEIVKEEQDGNCN